MMNHGLFRWISQVLLLSDSGRPYLVLRGSGGPLPCSFLTSSSLLRRRTSLSFPREPLRWRAPLPSCRHTQASTHTVLGAQPTWCVCVCRQELLWMTSYQVKSRLSSSGCVMCMLCMCWSCWAQLLKTLPESLLCSFMFILNMSRLYCVQSIMVGSIMLISLYPIYRQNDWSVWEEPGQ